jgi:hypothetical protein
MGIDGEIYISLDLKGRVRRLLVEQPEIVPAPDPSALAPSSEIDESLLLRLCGLEGANMRRAEPRTLFGTRTDRILAWEGVWPERPEIPVRVEAGFTDGRVSYLASFSPWELDAMSPVAVPADEATLDPADTRVKRVLEALGAVLGSSLFVAVLVLIFCRRLAFPAQPAERQGRHPRRGSLRLVHRHHDAHRALDGRVRACAAHAFRCAGHPRVGARSWRLDPGRRTLRIEPIVAGAGRRR